MHLPSIQEASGSFPSMKVVGGNQSKGELVDSCSEKSKMGHNTGFRQTQGILKTEKNWVCPKTCQLIPDPINLTTKINLYQLI